MPRLIDDEKRLGELDIRIPTRDELRELLACAQAVREIEKWSKAQAQCDDWGGENGRELLTIINRHLGGEKES